MNEYGTLTGIHAAVVSPSENSVEVELVNIGAVEVGFPFDGRDPSPVSRRYTKLIDALLCNECGVSYSLLGKEREREWTRVLVESLNIGFGNECIEMFHETRLDVDRSAHAAMEHRGRSARLTLLRTCQDQGENWKEKRSHEPSAY